MKRLNDEIYFEETKRKETKLTTSCQVIITLDQSIGSTLLHHKFKYQTSELQLFLQNVPILHWYPLKVIGTTIDNIDACLFSAVMRINFYNPSISNVVDNMLYLYCNESYDSIFDDENTKTSKQKFGKLLKSLLNDELFILQALREFKKGENNKNPLEYISDQLKDDEKFMLKAIKITGRNALEYASDRLRKILLKGIENDQLSSYFEDEQESDNDKKDDGDDQSFYDKREKIILDSIKSKSKLEPFILQMLEENDYYLFRSFFRLNDNELIVKELIKNDSRAFKYASNRLKNNEEFILGALKMNCGVLNYISNRLNNNEEFILEAVKQNGQALQFAPYRLKNDEQFVLEAVKQDGQALKHASERLQDKEEIVLEAVKQNGDALQYASNRLKNNEEILIQAVEQTGNLLEYASEVVKKNDGISIKYASDRLKDSEKFILQAVKHNYCNFKYASTRLQDNGEFVLQAVKQNGCALYFASDRLKDNEKIVMEAIKQDSHALKYASSRLRNDFNFANEIFNNCNTLEVFEHFGEELRNIEFIYYYIENYQSKFHELIRKNIRRRESNAYNDFFKIINAEEENLKLNKLFER